MTWRAASSITNISIILMAIISCFIALFPPAAHFAVSYRNMAVTTHTEMAFSASAIERIVANNLKSWQYEEHRLREILERSLNPSSDRETRMIKDLHGNEIAQIKRPLTWPVLAFSHPIYDSGTVAGHIVFERSMTPLVVRIAFVGAASTLLGLVIFLLFYFFPLRTIREAHRNLRENEYRLSLALNAGHFGVLDWNIQKNIVIWDDRMYEIYGMSRNGGDVSPDIWQECILREDRIRFMKEIRPETMGENGCDTEFRIVLPDETLRYVKIDGIVVLGQDGKPARLIGLNSDITKQKQAYEDIRKSEERYRTIFENTATANIIVNEDMTILMANDDFVRLSEYNKQALEGQINAVIFIHEQDLERMKRYAKARRTDPGSAPASYEFRFINRNGDVRDLFLRAAAIPESDEAIVSLIDLTERKQLETQLAQAQKMESVGHLAGGVAHVFNNMLGVILGHAELAMDLATPSDPINESLQQIIYAAKRSADLTRQLLAYAQKQIISPRAIDLNDSLSSMHKTLQGLISENIKVIWIPGHDVRRVRIDPSQVEQIMTNLMVNAGDAANKARKIIIETSNTKCDEAFCSNHPGCVPGEYVLLTLSDDGCGMDKEALANIFEPFFALHKNTLETNLGLATVYGIVKQNNGFIYAYSEPALGTTIRIYLPRFDAKNMETADGPPVNPV